MASRIQLRRDTAANWVAQNNILANGEQGYETDTNKMKMGDGVTAWNSLAYFYQDPLGGGISWGDITGTIAAQTDLQAELDLKSDTNHNHTGVYEPADATILKDSDIGVTVEAFDATIVKDADIGVTVQAYDATILVDADIGVNVQAYDATILVDADIGTTVASETHLHTGTYEPADPTILKDADIGVTVQGYDATILVDADIGVNVEAYDATILKDADIGTTVASQTHSHTGIYEPADATILKDADIGVNVQAFNANIQPHVTAVTGNPHNVTKADVGLSNADNTSDALKPISNATQSALDLKINTAEKASANGVATLGADSKIPNAQLPALAITSTYVVATEIAQLALTVQEGDCAVRTDENKSYLALNAVNATMGDWQVLLTPTDAVLSVDGNVGAVDLTNDYEPKNLNIQTHISAVTGNPHAVTQTEVGLGNVDNTSDLLKPISTATQSALDLKEPADSTILKDADIGVTVASETHVHEGTEIDSTAVTADYILTADGAGNSTWEANLGGSSLQDITNEPIDDLVDVDVNHSYHGRYWQIYVHDNADSGVTRVELVEMEMKGVPGGPDLTGAGVATASSDNSGSFPAGNAFDNSLATFWATDWTASGQPTADEWVTYDFLDDVTIEEITMRAGVGAPARWRMPKEFELRVSSDNIRWTTVQTYTNINYTDGELKTFNTFPIRTLGAGDALIYNESRGWLAENALTSDLTPTLGGDLDVNGFKLTSNTTYVESGNRMRALVSIDAGGGTNNSLLISDSLFVSQLSISYVGSSDQVFFTNNTPNPLKIDDINWLTADGTANQVIKTDGTGNLGWFDAEPADPTILKDADIGVTVQGYDATILVDADIGVTVEAFDATILKDSDIGVTVQGYDATTLTGASSVTDLTDVTITTPATDDTLIYNGSVWINTPALPGTEVQKTIGTIAAQSGSTNIPYDSTPPLITEGTEFGTSPFTMTGAANDVHVHFSLVVEASVNNPDVILAVFRDSTCIAAYPVGTNTSGSSLPVSLHFTDAPGDTAAHTYSGRIGISSGTWSINSPSGGNLGGLVVPGSEFSLTEIVH